MKHYSQLKKIAVEEHWATEEFREYTMTLPGFGNFYKGNRGVEAHMADMWKRLIDLNGGRLEEMDRNGIDMQVLSLNPPGIQLEPDANKAVHMARRLNDLLSKTIAQHPDRFAGLAVLPMQSPPEAADELERAVELGINGAHVNSHTNGEYLDNPKFWTVLERAEALGIPLSIHPSSPVEQPSVYRGYPELMGPIWGWGVEAASHALRLVFSGIFERFPDLTLILGHLGEMLPFVLKRLDSRWKSFGRGDSKLSMPPSQYIKEHFMVSTSGLFSPESLMLAISTMGAARILFAVDYPYESIEEGVAFIDNAPISDSDREKICYLNAKRVFKLSSSFAEVGSRSQEAACQEHTTK